MEINALTRDQMRAWFVSKGEKAFRGDQLFRFFNKEKELDLDGLTVFPKALRAGLKEEDISRLSIHDRLDSRVDKTKKYIFNLDDGNRIETVFMSYPAYDTLCLSSQVGCRMGCAFCASTKDRFVRNLSAAEMANQIYMVEKDLGSRIDHIVLMGIGEPLDNYDEVIRFINIINDPQGANIGQRHITLSTSGLVPQIDRLADQGLQINLAISLHYPNDEQRRAYMPVAKRYDLESLIASGKRYFDRTGRRVSYEYVVISGLNDTEAHADQLKVLLKGQPAHINLIPLNPIEEFQDGRTEKGTGERFKALLERRQLNATLRKKQGLDIDAACGQLRNHYDRGEH